MHVEQRAIGIEHMEPRGTRHGPISVAAIGAAALFRPAAESMIPKSGDRFSDEIMLKRRI
jgi:hypothetical protein